MTAGNHSVTPSLGDAEAGTRLSEWMVISQQQIDSFAEATGDHQWIHKSSPETDTNLFGGAIAHGLLVLSCAFKLAREAGVLPQSTWIVCGYDKLRFRAPVRSGRRIRCRTTVLDTFPVGARTMSTVRFEVEIQGEKVPALVADCSLLCLK